MKEVLRKIIACSTPRAVPVIIFFVVAFVLVFLLFHLVLHFRDIFGLVPNDSAKGVITDRPPLSLAQIIPLTLLSAVILLIIPEVPDLISRLKRISIAGTGIELHESVEMKRDSQLVNVYGSGHAIKGRWLEAANFYLHVRNTPGAENKIRNLLGSVDLLIEICDQPSTDRTTLDKRRVEDESEWNTYLEKYLKQAEKFCYHAIICCKTLPAGDERNKQLAKSYFFRARVHARRSKNKEEYKTKAIDCARDAIGLDASNLDYIAADDELACIVNDQGILPKGEKTFCKQRVRTQVEEKFLDL